METALKYKVQVFPGDKNLLVTTLNPTGEYFYRLKKPDDLHWGLFCCPIAFFDKNDSLIYHKQNQLAQIGLTEANPHEIVSWSKSGSLAFFVERNSVDTCWRVLLDLKLKEVCRIEYEKSDDDLFNTISQGNFDDSVIKANPFFEFKKFTPEKIESSLIEFFGFSTWRPKR